MIFDIQIGQVWRHHHEDDDHPSYSWDDLYLFIENGFPNCDAFRAINLENGKVTFVFPADPPKTDWERVL